GCRRASLLSGEREEDLFETHPHGSELQEAPSARDHRARQVATYVVASLALNFIANLPVAAIRFGDARHADDRRENGRGVAATRVDLDIHGFRSPETGRQI